MLRTTLLLACGVWAVGLVSTSAIVSATAPVAANENEPPIGAMLNQLIDGGSFSEPSHRQWAESHEAVRGFTSWLGAWSPVDDGELNATVKTDPPAAEKGRAAAARITSNRTAAGDVVETAVDLRTTEPAGLLTNVGPADSGDGWDGYTGYTVELHPGKGQVVLRKGVRLGEHKVLKTANVTLNPGDWAGLALHQEGQVLEVKLDGKVVMYFEDPQPLQPARIGVFTSGETRFKGLKLKTRTGGWWDIPFRDNDLIAQPDDAISLRWEKVQTGTAEGTFSLEATRGWQPGKSGQTITHQKGDGEVGIDNAGARRSGIQLLSGRPYEGRVQLRTAGAVEIQVSLRSADGSKVYASQVFSTNAKADGYQPFNFSLTPDQADPEGRFAITLRKPGSVTVGYAFLQRGEWGRYKGLPIRRELAETFVARVTRLLKVIGVE